ncbi:hypothetical protein TDB9533_04201 [Thalassocella blandensis]|nr:hypothetical protein TDB9533_04201 [Thalassocella blandensis]
MRKKISLISAALMLVSSASFAQNRPIKIIEPQAPTEAAKSAAIDTEHFEIGINLGLLTVEDFNTNPMYGVWGNYYINEKFFAYVGYGTSDTEKSNAEGVFDFNPDKTFDFASVGVGYRVLNGRSFWGKNRKYNTGLFAVAGVEQVDFAEDSGTGFMIGLSHKTVLTDYLALNIDLKDHIVSRTFVGEDKMTQNIEFTVGLSTFF